MKRIITRLGACTALLLAVFVASCGEDRPMEPPSQTEVTQTPLFGLTETPNGPGECLGADAVAGDITSGLAVPGDGSDLNCTSNDVDISQAVISEYRVGNPPTGDFIPLPAGGTIDCLSGDIIEARTDLLVQNNAKARYDLGAWINPDPTEFDPTGNGLGAQLGTECLHFNLVNGQGDAEILDDTPDQCGDVAAGQLLTIDLDVLTFACEDPDNNGQVDIDACAAWHNSTTGTGEVICPLDPPKAGDPTGFRHGTGPETKAKCRCEGLNLPINIKAVLRVAKVTKPDPDPTDPDKDFDFTPTGYGSAFQLSNGETNSSGAIDAGTVSVAETVPAGWDLTDLVCVNTSDQSAHDHTVTDNSVEVELAAGEDVTCTFTNTLIPTLTVIKDLIPSSDAGLFNLQIDAVTKAANVGDGGTTGAQEVSIGAHTVGETAGTNTNLSDYMTLISGDCGTDGSVTLAAGDAKTCTITNTRDAVLKVTKVLIPSSDAGLFNLQIDAVTKAADVGDGGTTGFQVVSIGAHTVGETAGTGTSLSDYITVISGDCGTNGSVTVAAGDMKECTITNTRKPTLKVTKLLDPTDDSGLFNLQIDGTTEEADAGHNGTTGQVIVTIGGHTVSETAGTNTSLSDYITVIEGDCGSDGSVTLAAGDNKECTITNTRKPTLKVTKILDPTDDPGLFNLQIDGTTEEADAGHNGTTGQVIVTIGGHTVSETAGTGTSLADYTTVIGGDCGSNGSVTVAAGDNKECTITNTRKPTLTVTKILDPTDDPGLFNLQIDGTTEEADAGHNGTTGQVIVTIGGHTVSETAGTGTSLADYTTVIDGDCGSDGSVTVAAGDNKECTITNTRIPTLKVTKLLDPTDDPGLFNLQIDAVTKAANVGHNGTTGFQQVSIGGHTVGETAGTGTSLANYTTVIGGDCAANGSVTLAAGDAKECTITNTLIPICGPGDRLVSVTLEVLSGGPVDLEWTDDNGNIAKPGFTGFTAVPGNPQPNGAEFTITPSGDFFDSQNLRYKVDGVASKSLKTHLSCSDNPQPGVTTYSGDGVTLLLVTFVPSQF